MVEQGKTNNGFDVKHAIKLLYGRIFVTKDIVKNIGSNYGLKKVIAFVNYANCLGTAILNLRALKNIGLIKFLGSSEITEILNISFMMEPIFTKMAA